MVLGLRPAACGEGRLTGAPLERPSTVVFLGPSLAVADARAVLDADYRPPVRKGDIYRCLATGVTTIAIVDGVFHSEPSVWQREILEALDEGLHVLGASSMGALRAAELWPFGMVGIGTIFEWFRDGVLDGDDEVALVFGPAELGHAALSEPLVNIRATLARAVSEGCLEGDEAQALIGHAKRLFYPSRSYGALLECPAAVTWPDARRRRLERFLASRVVDLKREDALALLRHVAAGAPGPQPPRRAARTVHRARTSYRRPAIAPPEVVERLRRTLNRRWYLLSWAGETGHPCPADVQTSFVERFERRHHVLDRSSWLTARALTEGEYLARLAEEAHAGWLRGCGAARFGLSQDGEDPDAPFLADWARLFGIVPAAGAPLVEWLVESGPERFGFFSDRTSRLRTEIQLTETSA